MGNSKIRIRMGQIEVEYEGSEAFLKKELHELLEAVSKLYHESGEVEAKSDADSSRSNGLDHKNASGKTLQRTTANIAAKLSVKTGNGKGLITAAAAHLALVKKAETFSRQQLLDEAKSATAYFKQSIRTNLSSTLTQLVKDDVLVENAKDSYALSATKLEELENALVN